MLQLIQEMTSLTGIENTVMMMLSLEKIEALAIDGGGQMRKKIQRMNLMDTRKLDMLISDSADTETEYTLDILCLMALADAFGFEYDKFVQ